MVKAVAKRPNILVNIEYVIMTVRVCKRLRFAGGWFFNKDSWFAERKCGRSPAY
jgi:hypothetical protein